MYTGQVDKVSILGNSIGYSKVLERRVEELEASKEQEGSEDKAKEHPDIVERTSDNYCRDGLSYGKQSVVNKRKACEMDGADEELNWVWSKDGLADLTVTVVDKEVVIEMKCPWRECLLMEIVEAISTLHLDPNMIQSCTTDGTLTLTLKSKVKLKKGVIITVYVVDYDFPDRFLVTYLCMTCIHGEIFLLSALQVIEFYRTDDYICIVIAPYWSTLWLTQSKVQSSM